MRARARFELLCGDAQYARGLKRTNIHRRMLKRRRHGLGERLARAELRHRAVLPTLRHACLHDARNNHWVKIHAIAGTTQQLAFRQLHNARIDFAQQIAQVLHGNALEHGRRMQRANKILRKLHATHQFLATLVALANVPRASLVCVRPHMAAPSLRPFPPSRRNQPPGNICYRKLPLSNSLSHCAAFCKHRVIFFPNKKGDPLGCLSPNQREALLASNLVRSKPGKASGPLSRFTPFTPRPSCSRTRHRKQQRARGISTASPSQKLASQNLPEVLTHPLLSRGLTPTVCDLPPQARRAARRLPRGWRPSRTRTA